jgi:pyridoxal phosphate enzyme (YggS family)
VTKGFPASDIAALASLGVAEIGESRDQEARPKAEALTALAAAGGSTPAAPGWSQERPLRWHMIGQLQTNKARSVARWADLVHTVDRPALVAALDRAAATRTEPLPVLVQLSVDGDPARGGAEPDGVRRLAERIGAAEHLALKGLMAVAPRDGDPAASFEAAAALATELAGTYPAADIYSAGMSGDLEHAIAAGATHVRVGTALLGTRSTFV